MPENKKQKTLIVVSGPTASGKTQVAIRLAQHFETSIISADSRQFYQRLKIGTAAPRPDELAAATHYLVGNLSIEDYYNASHFERDALQILDKIFIKNETAILAGGSGMYIDAVCKGIDDMPDADMELRESIHSQFQEKGIEFLQEQVKTLDPEYYEMVDKANPNRLKRAIEVCRQTGRTFTSFRQGRKVERNFAIVKIGLNMPRPELFERIAQRTDAMIVQGLVEEVKSLQGFRHLNAMNTVGYKEIFEYLDGNITLDRAIENIKTNTRRYAKRQLTWLKRDEEIKWFLPSQIEEIIRYIESKKIIQ